jgi:hypothetical protein
MLPTPHDLQYFDGLETVALQAAGSLTTLSVAGALRRRVREREGAPSGGVVLAADAVWHLPSEIVAEAPTPGAKIIDAAGVVWTVLRVDRETLGARWECRSRNLTLALGLEHLVQVEQATWSNDVAGAPVATWNLIRTGLRARIQPIAATHAVRESQRLERVTHEIYLAEALLLDESHRIVHAGVIYNVRGYVAPERIDAPLVLYAEQVPWPWS